MEKQTNLNAGAVKNGIYMDVDLAFDTNTATVGYFMAMVSKQRKTEE